MTENWRESTLSAELARLRAENEELREALREMTVHLEGVGAKPVMVPVAPAIREALRLRFTCPLCGTENEPTHGDVVMGERYQCDGCGTALVFSVRSPELDAMHDEVAGEDGPQW